MKCCFIPLIKAQVSTVVLYLIGLPTLRNHWELLATLLSQEGSVRGSQSGACVGRCSLAVWAPSSCWIQKWELRSIKTVELTDPGKQGGFQMRISHASFSRQDVTPSLLKSLKKKSKNPQVSTASAGWGSGGYCAWQGDDSVQCMMCNCCSRGDRAFLPQIHILSTWLLEVSAGDSSRECGFLSESEGL